MLTKLLLWVEECLSLCKTDFPITCIFEFSVLQYYSAKFISEVWEIFIIGLSSVKFGIYILKYIFWMVIIDQFSGWFCVVLQKMLGSLGGFRWFWVVSGCSIF